MKRACANCRREIDVRVGQRATERGVTWHASYTCPHCGAAIEADDAGPTPGDVRDAILAEEGEFQLQIQSVQAARLMHVLRDALGLSLEEVLEPGTLTTGTRTEMEWLASKLKREDIQATVLRSSSP